MQCLGEERVRSNRVGLPTSGRGIVSFSWLVFAASATAQGLIWPDLSTTPHIGGGAKDAAVVVAIQDYTFVSDILGAKDNGLDWYTHLTEGLGIPASRVRLLLDREGTREEITYAIEQARGAVKPGGTLWFVFIGHGAPSEDGRDGLLLGWDTQQTAKSVYARGIRQSELVATLERGQQAETVVILDACFSGQSNNGAPLVANLQPMIPGYAVNAGNTTVLSAGRSNEFAGPLPGAARPAFSYLLLGAIRGWGDEDNNGEVTAREAVDYTRGVLDALPLGRSQTPQLAGRNAGLRLGQGRDDGPKMSQVRKALAATTPTLTGEGVQVQVGDVNLTETLETLEALQAESELSPEELARRRLEIATEIQSQMDTMREEARRYYARVSALAEKGDEPGRQALQAFVRKYESANIRVNNQTYAVSIPELDTARAWLAVYNTGSDERQPLSTRYEMIRIEPGTFRMGSPESERDRIAVETQHTVRITQAYALGATEVTQGLWEEVMGANPSRFASCGPNCPVETVNWLEAIRFANAMSEREGLEQCYGIIEDRVLWPKGLRCEGYRLPTEAEWEYAARAGTQTTFSWGAFWEEAVVKQYAWYDKNAYDRDWTSPHAANTGPQEVGQKAPNAWGLFDMTGNISEWCWDRFGPYPTGTRTDPIGPDNDRDRIVRGGSWAHELRWARPASRTERGEDHANVAVGLRLARTL